MKWAWNVARITEKINRILVGGPEARRPFGTPMSGWDDNIKMNIKELGLMTCTGFMLLTICNAPLSTRQWAFGLHQMLGISWLAEGLLASHEGLCSMVWCYYGKTLLRRCLLGVWFDFPKCYFRSCTTFVLACPNISLSKPESYLLQYDVAVSFHICTYWPAVMISKFDYNLYEYCRCKFFK